MNNFVKKESLGDRFRKRLGMNTALQGLEQEIEECQKYLAFAREIDSFIKNGSKIAFDYEIYSVGLSKLTSVKDLANAKTLIMKKLNLYIINALKNIKDPIHDSLKNLENLREEHLYYESYKSLVSVHNYDDLDQNIKTIFLEIAKIQANPKYLKLKNK